MLAKRTQAIKDSLFAHPRQVSLELARLYMESYQQTEGEPVVIRRAKAFRHLLQNHRIVIDGYDLLVGNCTETSRAGVVSPEMSPYWILDELDEFPTRPQDTFEMSEEDKAYYREVLYPLWKGQSLNDWHTAHEEPACKEAERTKVFAVAQTDKGQGHIIADLPLVLTRGHGAILAEARHRSAEEPDNDFLRASVITLEATIAYIRRYEGVCCEMAAAAGIAPQRAASSTPLLSALVQDCLRCERDITEGGARYNPSGVQGVVARLSLIPGYTDGEDNVRANAERARELGLRRADVLPFHQLGESKYESLGMPYAMEDVPQLADGDATVQRAVRICREAGLEVVIRGE